MFNLDIQLFNCLYSYCRSLGNAFSMGVFEGFVLYSSVIVLAIVKASDGYSKKVK